MIIGFSFLLGFSSIVFKLLCIPAKGKVNLIIMWNRILIHNYIFESYSIILELLDFIVVSEDYVGFKPIRYYLHCKYSVSLCFPHT